MDCDLQTKAPHLPSHALCSAVKDATGTSVSTYTTHRRMGIAAMALGLFQLTALAFRQVCLALEVCSRPGKI